jgi:hypothetical protein
MNLDPTRAFAFILIAVHIVLGLWALVGFAEWFLPSVPWPRVSNSLFPRGILFAQWLLTLTAAVVFITGYTRRWPRTPIAMACVYAAMAMLCAVQTFGYMESETRFVAMATEYLAYAGILVFLFRARLFRPA